MASGFSPGQGRREKAYPQIPEIASTSRCKWSVGGAMVPCFDSTPSRGAGDAARRAVGETGQARYGMIPAARCRLGANECGNISPANQRQSSPRLVREGAWEIEQERSITGMARHMYVMKRERNKAET